MRLAVLTSYLHVCCYLVFSVASRHTLAMSHQNHRYSVVDLGVSSFSLRTLHPNSRATLLMSRFFVSDGVILRSVISLVWPGVRSLANSACLPTLMCRGVGSISVCTPKAPFFFAHKTWPKFEKNPGLPFGSLEASTPERFCGSMANAQDVAFVRRGVIQWPRCPGQGELQPPIVRQSCRFGLGGMKPWMLSYVSPGWGREEVGKWNSKIFVPKFGG